MKTRTLLVIVLLIGFLPGFSQYLLNPSFEGTILMIGPPPEWDICISGSTPNVQPGKYNVYLPASNGITYIGLYTREIGTWEDTQATFVTPLSKDSCYIFKIDLAYQEVLTYNAVDPVVLKIYGDDNFCEKDNLLWQSPVIDNLEWVEFEFLIHNEEFDITDLVLEAYYVNPTYPTWGYVLIDNIRITQTPQVELGNDTILTFCEVDSLILDPGSGYNSYLWPDGSTGSTFVVDTSGVYWVEVTGDYGCTGSDTIEIIIEEYVDMVSETIDSTMVCEGQEITITAVILNGVEPYSYEWLNLPDTIESVTIIADTTMFYYVTITDDCGVTLTDSIKIVVIESPDIDLGNDTLICPDGEYNIQAGEGYFQYLWQDGSTDSVLNVTEPGIYWVQVTSNFGCIAFDSITIETFPPIPLYLGNDTVLCIGDSVVFNCGISFVEYLWQDNSSDTSFTAFNTGVYWVTVTDQYGCHATDSILANFLALPEIDLGNDLDMCEGEEVVLDAGIGFLSYQWQDDNNSQYYSVTQSGWYWVTVDNGCGQDTDSVYVEVYPAPEPQLGTDTTICNGESILLDLENLYLSYLWQDNSTLPFYEAFYPGLYVVTVENNYGCFGEDEIFINFSDIQVDLGGDKQICEGETEILDAGSGFASYLWQDNSDEQTYVVSLPGIYSITVEDMYGCQTTDEVSYSYYPYPNPNLGPDQIICEGDSTILQAPGGDYQYYWNGQPGGQNFEVSAQGQYTLTLVNPCDSVTDEIVINVDPVPEVYLGEDDVLFPGQVINLDAGSGFDEYLWQDGSGGQYLVVTENNIDPDNPYFHVIVTQGVCKNTDTIWIELYRVWVPNVITPNGDGKNDMFMADTEKWSGISKHSMKVFNRWGEKVWESNDFQTGWDGRRNGRYVAEGTYFWILDVFAGPDQISQTLKGTLSVLGTNN